MSKTGKELEEAKILSKSIIRYNNLKGHKRFDRLTGITVETFDSLCQILRRKPIMYESGWKVKTVSFEDQVLVFLLKMRLNLTFDFLSILFQKNRGTITNVFYTFLYSFYYTFYQDVMDVIPSLNKVRPSCPDSFKNFSNCRTVIDCDEFFVEPSKILSVKCATYSNYKNRNTFKILIAIAPNGSIVFVSDCYGGSTSDKCIVLHSKFLDKLEIGDMVLADKGFLLHDVMPDGVSLVTPDYLVNEQFTVQQVNRNKQISSARVHVERAIQRMRVFRIISLLPPYLRVRSSVLLKVAGFLANCMPPLMQENIGKQRRKRKKL